MANFAPFSPIFIFQLLGTIFCATVYLKKQYGENDLYIESWGKTNCSLNGIDIASLGIGRPCEEWPDLATIFCDGKILEAVNYWGERTLFMRDSKHFVDRPLLKDAKKVVEEFKTIFEVTEWNKFMVSEMSEAQVDKLAKFVKQNFGMADEALIEHVPEDWVESPSNFKKIKDKKLGKWATELNKMWKEMSKKMPKDMDKNGNQRHSLIYLSNPFFVSGGRFREFRYWDSYWMARGLIASGMTKSVKHMCQNFAEMINRFGFVPAGGRIYYNKRSQPPFLTFLVYDYFAATGDTEFLKEIMPTLEKELNFWQTNRSIQTKVNGKTKTFYQYRADTKLPRSEAFRQDVELVKDIADPMEKAKIWHEIASASESGWDFSSRWIRKDESDKENPWKLKNLMTTKIVPVDLNALICGSFEKMAHLYLQIGNKDKSREYHAKYQVFLADFESLFYKKEHDIWYDFNLKSGALNEAYYGSSTVPLFTRCYDTFDFGTAQRMFDRMEQLDKDNKLISHPFGVPASMIDSSQQWDFPNIMPPSQHMLIEGLRRSKDKKMEDKALEFAQKWVSANFKLYQSKQNCGRKMWEKITANGGKPGKGGEYNVQMHFGWTIGILLDFLVTFGTKLKLDDADGVNCEQKQMEPEPVIFPNELSDFRSQRLTEAQKNVEEINKSQKYWKAGIYEPLAMLTKEEFKKLLGVPMEKKIGPKNLQLKSVDDHHITQRDAKDLPDEFDVRQKWPECAGIISTIAQQGICGSCWAVASASTLSDRICIARLKKGKKSDKNDPKSHVSAQFTLEFSERPPIYGGCKGSLPNLAWNLYRRQVVSGTNYEMYDGCRPYTVGGFPAKPNRLDVHTKDEKSWKTKRPTCKKECVKKWIKTQYANQAIPEESFYKEMQSMPRVTETVLWEKKNWENEMMREIMANGSITAIYELYKDFSYLMENDKSQIYMHSTDESEGGHAVKIIGWGQDKIGNEFVKYWLIVNSWGKEWGMDGMFKIRRGVDECKIESWQITFGTPVV
ncbi:hypothetical protein niasHT_034260 [Heterodera trifolii]|uniref:Trehalase n=1 Tax=Heterodera trifolii TaxID=157864 RepID=A0ABD2ITZ4_9BILA